MSSTIRARSSRLRTSRVTSLKTRTSCFKVEVLEDDDSEDVGPNNKDPGDKVHDVNDLTDVGYSMNLVRLEDFVHEVSDIEDLVLDVRASSSTSRTSSSTSRTTSSVLDIKNEVLDVEDDVL